MSTGVLSYNNKNTEGFLGRIFGGDLIEGQASANPRIYSCNNLLNMATPPPPPNGFTTALSNPTIKDQLKDCPLYFPLFIDKPICSPTPCATALPQHRSSICSDDDCIIIKKMKTDISNKPHSHVAGVYRRIQSPDVKNNENADKTERGDHPYLRELERVLQKIGITYQPGTREASLSQAWIRDEDSTELYGTDKRDKQKKQSLIVKVNSGRALGDNSDMWIIATMADIDYYYGSKLIKNNITVNKRGTNTIVINEKGIDTDNAQSGMGGLMARVNFENFYKEETNGPRVDKTRATADGIITLNFSQPSTGGQQEVTVEGEKITGSNMDDVYKQLKKKLERKWNIGFLMTGNERYGWLDPRRERKPLLGIVTYNLLSKMKKKVSLYDYYRHLFHTGDIPNSSPNASPSKYISTYPDFNYSDDQNIAQDKSCHLLAVPESEYYDTMRIVYIEPGPLNNQGVGDYKYLPPYIFNSDYNKYESVLYSIGPIWDPRRSQDVYRKKVSPSTERCQSISDKYYHSGTSSPTRAPTSERNYWVSNQCKTYPVESPEFMKTMMSSPSPSAARKYYGEYPYNKTTLYGSMKESNSGKKSRYYHNDDTSNITKEYIYNSVSGYDNNDKYNRSVTKMNNEGGGPWKESDIMKKFGHQNSGFLEDCNYRECLTSVTTPTPLSRTWYNNKPDVSPEKVFIGIGDKPCPDSNGGCNNPYYQLDKKCNNRGTTPCPPKVCLIPEELWRQKLGYGNNPEDKNQFELEYGSKCRGVKIPLGIYDKQRTNSKYKDEKMRRILSGRNNKCALPCVYPDIAEDECKSMGSPYEWKLFYDGVQTKNRCVNLSVSQNEGTYCNGTSIVFQKCPELPSNNAINICSVNKSDYKTENQWGDSKYYLERKNHNVRIYRSPPPQDYKSISSFEKCLPKHEFYAPNINTIVSTLDNTHNFDNLNNNQSCQPKCSNRNQHPDSIPLPPTHSINEYTGRIECKRGKTIKSKQGDGIECKQRCLLPSGMDNTLRSIPPLCFIPGNNNNDYGVVRMQNTLQKLFYKDREEYLKHQESYEKLCEGSSDNIFSGSSPRYSPAPSAQPSQNPHPFCADKEYLNLNDKCMYYSSPRYYEVTCQNNNNLATPTPIPTASLSPQRLCDSLTRGSTIDLTKAGPSEIRFGENPGILLSHHSNNISQRFNLINSCASQTPLKIKKYYGCTLASTIDKDGKKQLTDEYIGRGCYKEKSTGQPSLQRFSSTTCSSPLRWRNGKCYKIDSVISSPTPSRAHPSTSPGFEIQKIQNMNLARNDEIYFGGQSCTKSGEIKKIYDYTNNLIKVSPTPVYSFNDVKGCEISKASEVNYGIKKEKCKGTVGVYMDIPKDSEIVKCPINSEHYGECTFKCKDNYKLYEYNRTSTSQNSHEYTPNEYFKAMCYNGKWIPFIKKNESYQEVECLKSGCGDINETIFKNKTITIDGQQITVNPITIKDATRDIPWNPKRKMKPNEEIEMRCEDLGVNDPTQQNQELKAKRRSQDKFTLKCENSEVIFKKANNTGTDLDIMRRCTLKNKRCFMPGSQQCAKEIHNPVVKPDYDEIDCNYSNNNNICGCKEGWYGSGYPSPHPKASPFPGCKRCNFGMTSTKGSNFNRDDCDCPSNSKFIVRGGVGNCECDPGYVGSSPPPGSYNSDILKCTISSPHRSCRDKKGLRDNDLNKREIYKWSSGGGAEGSCKCKSTDNYTYKLIDDGQLVWERSLGTWVRSSDTTKEKCVKASIHCKCYHGEAQSNCSYETKDTKSENIKSFCRLKGSESECKNTMKVWLSSPSPGHCKLDGKITESECTGDNLEWITTPTPSHCKIKNINEINCKDKLCKYKSIQCKRASDNYCEKCNDGHKLTDEIINKDGKHKRFCTRITPPCPSGKYYTGDDSVKECKDIVKCGNNTYITQPGTEGSRTICSSQCPQNEIAWTTNRRGDKLDRDARKNKCILRREHSPFCEKIEETYFGSDGLPYRNQKGICTICRNGYTQEFGQCFHNSYNNNNQKTLSEVATGMGDLRLQNNKRYILFKIALKPIQETPLEYFDGVQFSGIDNILKQKLYNVFIEHFKFENERRVNNGDPLWDGAGFKRRIHTNIRSAEKRSKTNNTCELLNVYIVIEPPSDKINETDLVKTDIIKSLMNDGEPIHITHDKKKYYIVGFPTFEDEITIKNYERDVVYESSSRQPLNQLCSVGGQSCSIPPPDFPVRRCEDNICTNSDYSESGKCCFIAQTPTDDGKIEMNESLLTLYNDVLQKTQTSMDNLRSIYEQYSRFIETNILQ